MSNIQGIEKIKGTRITGSRHSVPPHMTQAYVSLFMLRKQQERLEKEGIRLDTKRELIVERLKEIEKESKKLEKHDKRVHRRKDFDLDSVWVKVKKEAESEDSDKPKTGTGWNITTLKRKKQNF